MTPEAPVADVAPAAEESSSKVDAHDYRPPTDKVAEHQHEDTLHSLQAGGFNWCVPTKTIIKSFATPTFRHSRVTLF